MEEQTHLKMEFYHPLLDQMKNTEEAKKLRTEYSGDILTCAVIYFFLKKKKSCYTNNILCYYYTSENYCYIYIYIHTHTHTHIYIYIYFFFFFFGRLPHMHVLAFWVPNLNAQTCLDC